DTNFFGEIDEVNSGHNIIAGLEGHLPEANPLFANPISGAYRPVTGSPAIDAGSNQAYSDAGGNLDIDLDLGGTPRLMWGTIDMGAYEYPSPPASEMKEWDGKTYKLGDVITMAIDFHAPISVHGEPTLVISIGDDKKLVTFSELSEDSGIAKFVYKIVEGDAGDLYVGNMISNGIGNIAFIDSNLGTPSISYSVPDVSTILVDAVRPVLTEVSIASSNELADTAAAVGDYLTLRFEASEAVEKPAVTIGGQETTVMAEDADGILWKATYRLRASDVGGPIGFVISRLVDTVGNTAVDVREAADGSGVTFYNGPPVVTDVEDGIPYDMPVAPVFVEGTATLNGEPFTSGTPVTADGEYTLEVTDAAGNETVVRFTIAGEVADTTPPVVTGV